MSPRTLVVTLQPDANLTERLSAAKSKLLAACGPQMYLDHPPHLTLYVAVFADSDGALSALQALTARISAANVESLGWKVFENDALTGGHTVVCELSPDSQARLRHVQAAVLDCVADLRDPNASAARYAAAVSNMPEHRRRAVAERGFPFVGDDWLPHFTTASIKAADWDRGWAVLRDDPIRGKFRCSALNVYELTDGFPCDLVAWPLD